MENISINITAEKVAWYGAIVATLSFIFSFILGLLTYLRDRVKIKIKFYKDRLITSSQSIYPYDSDKVYILISIVNLGRRPVTISMVGYSFLGRNNNKHFIANDIIGKLPRVLKEGENVDILTDQSIINLEKIKSIFVITNAGKEYKKYVGSILKRAWYLFFKSEQ